MLTTASISVVLPAYNEEDNIETTILKVSQFMAGVCADWEVLVVNDGSADRTGAFCDAMTARVPQLRVFHHQGNRGYGAALKTGIQGSRKALIFFTDSDGQFDIQELSKLTEHIGAFDIVAGYRGKRVDPAHRLLNAWGWNLLVRTVLGLQVRDIDCAFKLFRREVFERIQIRSVGAMVNTEILAQAARFKMTLKEVEVTHFERVHGAPTGANLRVIAKAFRELFRLWWKLRAVAHDQAGLFPRSGPALATGAAKS